MIYRDAETVTISLERYDNLMEKERTLGLLITCDRGRNVAVIDRSRTLEFVNTKLKSYYVGGVTEIEFK